MAAKYRGINPLPNGGIDSPIVLHPYYQSQLPSNAFPNSNQPPVQPQGVFSVADLTRREFDKYAQQHTRRMRHPTRFDVQNQSLPIGGRPHYLHENVLGSQPRMAPISHVPESNMYVNPSPFDFGTAVRSTAPTPVTIPSETISRMMRPVDEVDSGLVTNPLPDPTFMARQPMFSKAVEDMETARRRTENTGRMRLW